MDPTQKSVMYKIENSNVCLSKDEEDFVKEASIAGEDREKLLRFAYSIRQEMLVGVNVNGDTVLQYDEGYRTFEGYQQFWEEIFYSTSRGQSRSQTRSRSGSIDTKTDEAELESATRDLNSMIGLSSVKNEIQSLTNLLRVQDARADHGLLADSVSNHLVFTGNPGTGKTTVARLLGRIFKATGLLKTGHLIETSRSGLVGEFIGSTAPKTEAVVTSALGGVLFIDEAYALTSDRSGLGHDFGGEAITTLVQQMENNRDRLVVIVAGYPTEMEEMIHSNPGLESRFTHYIEFPNYSTSELADIFVKMVKDQGYALPNGARITVLTAMAEMKDRASRGNGRFVRNYFERVRVAHANRVVGARQKNVLETIQVVDLLNAMGNK